jgi:thioredoxin 1
MKRITAYAIMSLIVMGGSMNCAEEKMVCKDGICSIEGNKNTAVVTEGKKVTTQENAINAVVEITAENFDAVIKKAQKPVIVDFYATWCQPCKSIKPIFAELAQQEKDWIFAAVDIDKNPTIMANCGVQVVPTFVIFKNGVQWGMIKGGLPKDQLMAEFKKAITIHQPVVLAQPNRTLELLIAVSQRNVDAVKKCVADGIDVNGIFEAPQGNMSALSVAVLTGTEEIIDFLISSGARMDKAVEESIKKQLETAVNMVAALQKNLDYAKHRIAHLPAPVKQIVKMNGPELSQQFMMAIANPALLKNLIDQGADVNLLFTLGKSQATPICLFIAVNNKEPLDMLIDAGALLSTEIIDEHGCKKSVEAGIKDDIEFMNKGAIKSRERLEYALSKKK